MEQFKITTFEKENPGKNFPKYREASSLELQEIQRQLRKILCIGNESSVLDITEGVRCNTDWLEIENAETDGFSIKATLKGVGVTPAGDLFINWHRYDKADVMSLELLNEYFDYLWYPGSDDIEVFDQSLSWILTIRHDGVVGIWLPMMPTELSGQ